MLNNSTIQDEHPSCQGVIQEDNLAEWLRRLTWVQKVPGSSPGSNIWWKHIRHDFCWSLRNPLRQGTCTSLLSRLDGTINRGLFWQHMHSIWHGIKISWHSTEGGSVIVVLRECQSHTDNQHAPYKWRWICGQRKKVYDWQRKKRNDWVINDGGKRGSWPWTCVLTLFYPGRQPIS